jgi:hypothetical protein
MMSNRVYSAVILSIVLLGGIGLGCSPKYNPFADIQCDILSFPPLSGYQYITEEPYINGDDVLAYTFRFHEDCTGSFEYEVQNSNPANSYRYIMHGKLVQVLEPIMEDSFTTRVPGKFVLTFSTIDYWKDGIQLDLRSWEYGWSLPHSSNNRIPASGEYLRGIFEPVFEGEDADSNIFRFYLPDPPLKLTDSMCKELDEGCVDPTTIPEHEYWADLRFTESTLIETE